MPQDLIAKPRDMDLIVRAVNSQWPTSDEMRAKCMQRLEEFVESDDPEMSMKAIESIRKIEQHNWQMIRGASPVANMHLHQHKHGGSDATSSPLEGLSFDERQEYLRRRVERLNRISSQ
jgi:hypothetical protein